MNNDRRVVVTGIGVISAVGNGKETFWKAIKEGKSGISEITSMDTSVYKCHLGGEVKDFNPEEFIPKRRIKFLGRSSQLAIAASSLALKDAKLDYKSTERKEMGVIVGTTTGERPLEELLASWAKGGFKDVDRAKVFQATVNNISANVGIEFKARGVNYLIPTACAAGNYAIGCGFDLIRSGDLNFALVGGADAFSKFAFTGFQRIYAMSPDFMRPFDKNRRGMMQGEGSGMLLLESYKSAKKRGADIYAEVLGYGLSCDAYHATAPDPKGIAKVMEKALAETGLTYKDVDYICAHGTGTGPNDKAECIGIKAVFKERSKEIMVSSIKSMLGHAMGAASAIEAAACCLAVKDDIAPPTINYETPDPDCDIDCVPNKARKAKINVALNNGFAFGGNNACVVIKKIEDA
ncbi:MAG: beta-ketoacyl-[acyl-carrier-protein] synthase family protein [Candidatus Omnitrophica bacterium]|nr:beta-ketoacyl-[acyl-carrier-protein] synthase family protein [Candidatus Omnitrophota bacterium]